MCSIKRVPEHIVPAFGFPEEAVLTAAATTAAVVIAAAATTEAAAAASTEVAATDSKSSPPLGRVLINPPCLLYPRGRTSPSGHGKSVLCPLPEISASLDRLVGAREKG